MSDVTINQSIIVVLTRSRRDQRSGFVIHSWSNSMSIETWDEAKEREALWVSCSGLEVLLILTKVAMALSGLFTSRSRGSHRPTRPRWPWRPGRKAWSWSFSIDEENLGRHDEADILDRSKGSPEMTSWTNNIKTLFYSTVLGCDYVFAIHARGNVCQYRLILR